MEEEKQECHVCGKQDVELYVCKKCEELFCDECSALYNQFTQIDYNCCETCANQTRYD